MCNPLLTNPWSRQVVSMQQLVFLTLCIFIFKNEHCKNHTTTSASSIFRTASHSASFSVCQDEVWTFFTLWWKMYWVSSVLTSMGAQKLWLQGCRHRFSPSDSVSVVPEVSWRCEGECRARDSQFVYGGHLVVHCVIRFWNEKTACELMWIRNEGNMALW